MPVTVIATAGAVNANSYITLAAAETYFESRLHDTAWTAESDANKDQALVWATAILDAYFDWYGTIRTTTQKLRWPRSGVLDADGRWLDYDTIPEILENAVCELALEILKGDLTETPGLLGTGLSSFSLDGVLSLSIDKALVLPLITDHILVMLSQIGAIRPLAGGRNAMNMLKVQRT